MLFKKGTILFAYEIMRESGENVMYINYLGAPFVPNLADNPEVMSRTIDALIESSNVSRIVFVQQRNYNYDFSEVSLLLELAQLYNYLVKQERILSPERLVMQCQQCLSRRYDNMAYFSSIAEAGPFCSLF